MPNYKVYVTERTVLHIEADDREQAKDMATEDYIWGPDQLSPDYYDAWLDVEEDDFFPHRKKKEDNDD
tara:strand:- start:995 stop:1198 length:204 start_codon:yes stop_codon:yes gene_type:complete